VLVVQKVLKVSRSAQTANGRRWLRQSNQKGLAAKFDQQFREEHAEIQDEGVLVAMTLYRKAKAAADRVCSWKASVAFLVTDAKQLWSHRIRNFFRQPNVQVRRSWRGSTLQIY
jgi:hypothetical protein